MKEHYSSQGIRLAECCICHNLVPMAKAGKFRGSYYCDPHYILVLENQVKDWKIGYKRERNNKSWDEVKNHLPLMGSYIN
ncbi:MAG: hypothetical protein AABY22_25995 [Nanoarchaeota archaeon]